MRLVPAVALASVAMACVGMAQGQVRLKAELANTREVRVSWEGAPGKAAQLERQSGPDQWDAVATSGEGRATDATIAAYATYHYRVRADRVRADRVKAGTAISNVITVGPPPGGFHTIVPRPPCQHS